MNYKGIYEYVMANRQKLYKEKSKKNTTHDRLVAATTNRRINRDVLVNERRIIKEHDLPSESNQPSGSLISTERLKKKQMRQRLQEYKNKKQALKVKQQATKKPPFRVSKVSVPIGLPNLDTINKEIKGRRFDIKPKPEQMKSFAPANYTFKPPKNIKPLTLEVPTKKLQRQDAFDFTVKPADNIASRLRSRTVNSNKKVITTSNSKIKVENVSNKITAEKVKPKYAGSKITLNNLDKKNQTVKGKIGKSPAIKNKVTLSEETAKGGLKTPKNKLDSKTSSNLKATSPKEHNVIDKNVLENVELEKKVNSKTLRSLRKSTRLALREKSEVKDHFVVEPKAVFTPEKTEENVKRSVRKSARRTLYERNPEEEGEEMKTPRRRSRVKKSNGVADNIFKTPENDENFNAENVVAVRKVPRSARKSLRIEEKDSNVKEITRNLKTPNRKSIINENTQNLSQSEGDFQFGTTRKSRKVLRESNFSYPSYATPENFKANDEHLKRSTRKSASKTANGKNSEGRIKTPRRQSRRVNKSEDAAEVTSETPNGDAATRTPADGAAYISPFVTISRGKSNARKEYHTRRSLGGLFAASPELAKATSNAAGASHFQVVLDQEIEKIESICDRWNKLKEEEELPEEACNMINNAVGQSGLLLTKKFKQFQKLIDDCASGNADPPITCYDLHGYWDTAYIQVENLNKRFDDLTKLKENNWEEILPVVEVKKTKASRKAKKTQAKATSSLKDFIKAQREKAKTVTFVD